MPGPPQQRVLPMAPAPRTRSQQAHMWLGHPLLLLLCGSLLTGILVPSFTGKWQRNVTAQGMKTQVIGDATNAVSIPITQLSVTQNPVFGGNSGQGGSQTLPSSVYSAFLSKSDSVDSEIKAYFPQDHIATHWEDLSGLLQTFFLFTYANNPGLKQDYLHGIEHYFNVHHESGGIDWGLLQNGSWQVPGYYRDWQALEKKIIAVKSIVLGEIMNAPAPSF
jgi:hypothetical protein